jgi:Zn-dependent peptidase ImmA (M78 family)
MAGRAVTRPSPNLLDTIYLCQERQSWYRDFAAVGRHARLAFVGSLTTDVVPAEAATTMRRALGFDLEARRACPTWIEALRHFLDQADHLGVLVMASGIVGSNTHRALDPEEFRGFALSDSMAPLVFVNGADTKGAQMFTLAHELAHLWLGSSALSDATAGSEPAHEVERWCNAVAAELLVPLAAFREAVIRGENLDDALVRLARQFKVSTLVVLRRMRDCGRLDPDEFRRAYSAEVAKLIGIARGSGGNFYRTTVSRIGKRFCGALIESTLEGNTLYRDAFRMLGVTRSGTFDELSRNLGFAL